MIITCNNCNKIFDLKSDLIPEKGRLLQCGSCNHQWFFKKEVLPDNIKIQDSDSNTKAEFAIIPNKVEEAIVTKDPLKKKNKIEQNQQLKNNKNNKNNKKNIKKLGILNYTVVFIFSFTALIILIDTFKIPISKIIPNIEFILNNLYESIKDIFLFFKDLI